MLIFALIGSGCKGEIEIPALENSPPTPGRILAAPLPPVAAEAETEPPAGACFARARDFSGLVEMPCGDIARQIR